VTTPSDEGRPEASGSQDPGPTPPPGAGSEQAETLSSWTTASTDVLAAEPPRRSRTKAVVIGAVAVVIVLVAAGAAVAAKLLGGGGAQPETVVPADAAVFVKLDLDPSPGQKLAAFRFINKFPGAGDKLNADDDLIKKFFDAQAKDGSLKGIGYDTDVKPWLGKRIAFALLPPQSGSTEPVPIVAVQVTDADKAKAGLAKLDAASTKGGSWTGVEISGDYAVLAKTEAIARSAVQQAEKSPLAANKSFVADLDRLGSSGVAAGWVDLSGLGDLAKAAARAGAASISPQAQAMLDQRLQGRFASVLRFDGTTLELAGHVTGAKSAVTPPQGKVTNHIVDLPASTLGAVSINHVDAYVDQSFAQLRTMLGAQGEQVDQGLAQLEQQTGLKLPDDLKALLGSNLVVAVDKEGLQDTPQIGARVVTDPVKASDVLDKIEQAVTLFSGQPLALPRDETSDGYVVASTPGYLAALKKPGGLGHVQRFSDAVPGVGKADFAAYVDVAAIVDGYAKDMGATADDIANLKPLAALGMTATTESPGEGSFLVRLTTR
jgi:hypothetical protein